MGKKEKAILRLKSLPKDYKYSEARSLLRSLGYDEDSKGNTSGSRVMFHNSENDKILLHKPHPGDEMPSYAVKNLLEHLKERGIV